MSSGLCRALISTDVVEGCDGLGVVGVRHCNAAMRLFLGLICVLVSMCLAITPEASADESNPSSPSASASSSASSSSSASASSLSSTITDDITDTENLLGDNVSKVKDAIDNTQRQDGVHIRLLYLPSFGDDVKPAAWAAQVLEATDPESNTVLLAVGSDDGNLVVAVSKNSEEWLRSQETVDKLSTAAVMPIQQDNPDWAGSALALMQEVATLHDTSTSSRISRVGVILMAAALAAIIVITAIVILMRRRKQPRNQRGSNLGADARSRRQRHRAHGPRSRRRLDHGGRSSHRHSAHAHRRTTMKAVSASDVDALPDPDRASRGDAAGDEPRPSDSVE